MKYFVSLFLSLFFLVFISCGNEDNAWDNNIPIITSNEQSDSSGLLKSQITDIINYSKINFDENFNNTELYKNLILSLNGKMFLWFFRNKTHSIYVFLC